MTRGVRTALMVLVAVLVAKSPRAQTASPLEPDARVTREIASGDTHTYSLILRAGDFLRVTVGQRGIDLAIAIHRPDGTPLLDVDGCDDDFRDEVVAVEADVAGTYTFAIHPIRSTTARGRYELHVADLHPATAADRVRIEAERAFERGHASRMALRPGDYDEGIAAFTEAIAKYQEVGDRAGELKALTERSYLEFQLLRPEALESAQSAERIARELGDNAGLAAALHNLGQALERTGDMAGALAMHEQSTSMSRALGNRKAEASSLNSEGIWYGRSGDGEQAIARFERALPLARATGFIALQSFLLNNLGIAYKDLGEFERSLDVYSQALALRRDAHDLETQVVILNNMGQLHHLLKDDRKALELHLQALALSRESGGRENEARSLNTAGQSYYALGDYAKALEFHQQSLAIRRELGDLPGEAASLHSEGLAWQRLGNGERALADERQALEIWRRLRNQLSEINTLSDLASIEHAQGQTDQALAHIREAVDLEETLRDRMTSPAFRTTFLALGHDKYERFIDFLEDRRADDPSAAAAALDVNERARARVLLDALVDARVDLQTGVDPALRERERALQARLQDASARLSRVLTAKGGKDQAEAASRRVDDLTRSYQQLQAEIRRQSPHYAAVTRPEPLTSREIQQSLLDADTVLLEFALGDERSWLFAVTPDALTTVELPPRRTIESAARSLYQRFIARPPQRDTELRREAAAMSRMLLGGIAAPLRGAWRGKRLAIVASGALEYLPFGALPAPAAAGQPAQPLVAQHEIVNLPSASVVAVMRREVASRAPASHALAIVADPVFDRTDPRVHGSNRVPMTVPSGTRAGLTRLPFSREEANGIAALAPANEVLEATDFDANRETVVDGSLADYRIVHFATHGTIDSERASLSALVFSLVDEHGAARDGYVRIHDIYNLRLGADLVVLSACQTALGRQFKGEGLSGLARAFMYAGVPRVVASLWEVSDLATAELMKKFYRGMLEEHLRPAAALRAAQVEMSHDARWASPYFWAGFVLQGDWR